MPTDNSGPTNQQIIESILAEAHDMFVAKNNEYGNSFETNGGIALHFFPQGIELKTPLDFTRYDLFRALIGKINRYSKSFNTGGHKDSLIDLINYAAMLHLIDTKKPFDGNNSNDIV